MILISIEDWRFNFCTLFCHFCQKNHIFSLQQFIFSLYQFKNGNNHKIFRLFLMAFHFKSQVSLLQSSTFPLLRFSYLNKPLIHKNRLLCLVMRLVTNNSGNMIDFLSRQVVCLKTVCGGKIRLESVLFWFGLNVSCFGWLSFERKLKMGRYFD